MNMKKHKNSDNEKTEDIHLDKNEIPFHINANQISNLSKKISNLSFNRYPTDNQVQKIKVLLKLYLEKNNPGLKNVSIDNLCLGNGLDDLLFRIMHVFRDKKIGVFAPTFNCYDTYANMIDKKLIKVDLSDSYDLNIANSDRMIAHEPDILLLCYPNNPTGKCFNSEMIDYLLEKLPSTTFIFDEAYYDFSQKTYLDKINTYPDRIICMRSFSKSYGMAGVRIGFLVGNKEFVRHLKTYELPFHFNVLMLAILEEILQNPNIIDISEIVKEREFLFNELAKHDQIKVFPTDANFIWCQEKGQKGWISKKLEKHSIHVKQYQDFPGYYRISVGTRKENIKLLSILFNK